MVAVSLKNGDLHSAREACKTARSLNPEILNIELLETSVEGAIDDPGRLSAYEQIEAYQNSLRLDPECTATFYNIGTTYLHQLGDGKNAAEWLRKAVALDPGNKDFQRELQNAICRCDPVLKVINFPLHLLIRCGLFVGEFRARHPYAIVLALPILIPACLIAMIVGGLWVAFLYLPGRIYRFLAWSEITQKASGGERPGNGIYRFPLWCRLAVFLGLSIPLSFGVYWVFTQSSSKITADAVIGGGMIVGTVIGIWVSARKQR